MHRKHSLVLASLIGGAAINFAIAACTASSSVGGGGGDGGLIDAFFDALLGTGVVQAGPPASTLVTSGQLDVSVEPCTKEKISGGGYSYYYAEHTYPGYTADEIAARLRIVFGHDAIGLPPLAAPYPAYTYQPIGTDDSRGFQVKPDGTVGIICCEGTTGAGGCSGGAGGGTTSGGAPPPPPAIASQAHFIFQK